MKAADTSSPKSSDSSSSAPGPTPLHKHYADLLNRPDDLEIYRHELRSAQSKLEEYVHTLRVADIEIERRNSALKALTAFSYQASRLTEPQALTKLTLSQALGVTRASVGAVVIIDPETKALTLGAHTGLTEDFVRILTGRQFEGGASALMPFLVSGQGALLEKHSATGPGETMLLESTGLDSLVSLPLEAVHHLFGALVLGHRNESHFSPVDIHFLIGITQEASVALESIYVRDRMWRLIENLMGDGVNSDAISLSTLQEDIALSTLQPLSAQLAQIVANIGGIMGVLFRLKRTEDDMEIKLVADYGLSLTFTSSFTLFALSDDIFPFDQLARRDLVVRNIIGAHEIHPIPLLARFQEEGARSLIAVRFHEADKMAWVIMVAAAELNIFTALDLRHLQTMSQDSLVPFLQSSSLLPMMTPSVAPDNDPQSQIMQDEDLEALLGAIMAAEEEVQRHNADFVALNHLSESINQSLDLVEMTKHAVFQVQDILGTEIAWLYIIDELDHPQQLFLQAHTGLSAAYETRMKTLGWGEHLEGVVAQQDELHILEDTLQHAAEFTALTDIENILAAAAVPLRCSLEKSDLPRQIVGVLVVGMRHPYAWQPRQIRLLTAIGSQIAFMVRNVLLFREMETKIEQLGS